MTSQAPPLIVLVGPTAVGKSARALELAAALAGEIVSADSRLVYRGMDIGTDKPSPAEQARVPHHLIDVLAPDQAFSLVDYQALAHAAIADIGARGRVPLLVGGTGQYVWAVVEGWAVPRVGPDPVLRARLFAEAETQGATALHARLAQVDPAAAARIDARNVRRVVRALEVYELSGRPISDWQHKQAPPYRTLVLGLARPRPDLYARIDARIQHMVEQGLFDEVRDLVERGYSLDLPAMSGLGYRQVGLYLRGQVTRDEAIALIRRETRNLVRRQRNWFKPDDPRILWQPADAPTIHDDLITLAQDWLAGPACAPPSGPV
ncbi:MAG: tRNA (adenosine(37)-N6)-dimethylallyltransferase MiaA [Chloroflexi bacterium]|nr:tRNA (adenosine(37)-N6)-dimethylallyltransferase MiaA [Chloroflexota bacterium]MBU1749036.1 tRNA (adenosine(37)-N6)-dimethylallyltransferase MiaA [Chloroflexota bacterium]